MSQQHTVGRTATAIVTDNGMTKVVYHQTVVVSFDHAKVILNSGSWRTVTTKTRMNQAANQFGLEYRVYQEDSVWYVDTPAGTIPFKDGMKIERITHLCANHTR